MNSKINSKIAGSIRKTKEQNIFSPTCVYIGDVTIEHYHKNQKTTLKRHNTGLLPLFTAVTRALAGYDINKYKPTKIMIYNNNTESKKEMLIQKINYASTPTLFKYNSTDNTYERASGTENDTVEYRFVIPSSSFIISKSKIIEIGHLKLYNTLNKVCAELTLDESVKVTAGDNFIIKWKLRFQSNA